MKVAVAILGFIATGALAGGSSDDKYCKKIVYDPPQCPHYTRDLLELDERDDLDLEERDDIDLEERDEDLEERGGYYPPPPQKVCKKKCPKYNLKCTKYGWKKGYPKYKGSFEYKVDCKYGQDYTVTGQIEQIKKYSTSQYLVITYNAKYWPQDHKTSYVGIYAGSKYGPKKVKDLNYSSYCSGNTCTIPVEKLPGYPDLCDKDLWIAIDGGRCKNPSYGQYGYGKDYGKKPAPKDVIDYVKLHIECYGKKECKSYCCQI